MWDERYSEPGYAYGTEPNTFLVQAADRIRGERVLCLAEGEGRNAVWLAKRGLRVTAVDRSEVGLAKARALAEQRGVTIETICADLAEYDLGVERWDAIVSIFAHMPSAVRASLHRRAIAALAPGGIIILEAYTENQLSYGSGGPGIPDLLVDPDALNAELTELGYEHFEVKDREILEGRYHVGRGAVVQVIARKS